MCNKIEADLRAELRLADVDSDYYRELVAGLRSEIAGLRSEVAGLRSEIADSKGGN